MATWNSRGLRGSFLEELVNMTNDKYRSQKLALVQKVPTPSKPITIDQTTRDVYKRQVQQRERIRSMIFCMRKHCVFLKIWENLKIFQAG